MRGLRKRRGLWDRGLTGLMWLLYIYIVIWLERHGNRLYGVMGLLSKKVEWMDGYPFRLLQLLEHLHY